MIVASQKEKLFGWIYTIEQCEQLLLLISIIYFLELVKDRYCWSNDHLNKFVESFTSPWLVDDQRRNSFGCGIDANFLCEQRFAGPLFTSQ